ncbi:MAG: AraC family transcriptional regulator [Candidatus Alectryocaccobium sp.]|jgi:AraC-like DNA-binding protein/mannose-6-phosphate isomerase-like protein (cupin superfamily)
MESKAENRILSAQYERMFYDSAEYHEKSPMLYHRHKDFVEIHYVAGGKESYRVDNRIYDLKAGNVVIIDKGVWHGEELFLSEGCETYTCAVKNVKLNGTMLERIVEKNNRAVLEFEPGAAAEKLMIALYEIQLSPNVNSFLCDNLCSCILNIVYDKLGRTHDLEDKIVRKNDELIRLITEFLDENYTEELNLEDLGERFGLSHYYLAHIFKDETGISPMKYVMHRKIGEAQSLLKNTDMSISRIGDRLGFSSSCHLSSVFKKYFGISPKMYRQHYKEKSKKAGELKKELNQDDDSYFEYLRK